MAEEREGVGEEGAVGGGEGGDDVAKPRVGGGGPRGAADVSPEFVVGGDESVEEGGCAAYGGEGWAVEAGEYV